MNLKSKWVLALMLLVCIFAMTACGGGEEEVAAAEWPAQFADVPAFTTSPIESLEVVDDVTTTMQFSDVSQEQLDAYVTELLDAGFVYEGENGNIYTKVVGDLSYAVGWNIDGTTIKLILLSAPAADGPETVVAQWPAELDGITPFQGATPNDAMMNSDGVVTVDYSDVTTEMLDAYREGLAADGFSPYELESGVEAYAKVDAEGVSYLVLINPQDDVEGHLQISGVITPAE